MIISLSSDLSRTNRGSFTYKGFEMRPTDIDLLKGDAPALPVSVQITQLVNKIIMAENEGIAVTVDGGARTIVDVKTFALYNPTHPAVLASIARIKAWELELSKLPGGPEQLAAERAKKITEITSGAAYSDDRKTLATVSIEQAAAAGTQTIRAAQPAAQPAAAAALPVKTGLAAFAIPAAILTAAGFFL